MPKSVSGDTGDTERQVEQLQKRIALLKAQTELHQAEKSLADAEKPKTPVDAALENTKKVGDLADAQKKILDAVLPKALDGTTTVDANATFENQILAFDELLKIAHQMAKDIAQCVKRDETLVVQDDGDLAALALYEGTLADITLIRKAYEELAPAGGVPGRRERPPLSRGSLFDRIIVETHAIDMGDRLSLRHGLRPGTSESLLFMPALAAAAPVALQVGQTAVALAGLLKTNVQITGTPITLSETGLLAELAHGLGAEDIKVVSFALFPPKIDPEQSELVAQLEGLEKAREAAALRAEADTSDGHDVGHEHLKTLDAALAALHAELDKPIGTDGMSRLVALLRAEALERLLKRGAKYVSVRVLAAGGSTRTTQSVWPWIKRIKHSGGAIATFFVLDRSGTIECSRSLFSHSAYRPERNDGSAMPGNSWDPRPHRGFYRYVKILDRRRESQ
jgi:hypothetical protein